MMARSTPLQLEAGYIDARPLTASSSNSLATHGRTIHSGHFRRFLTKRADVRFPPISDRRPDIARGQQCAISRHTQLFDHLVDDGEYGRRNVEAKRLGRFEINDQRVFSRLLHRQVGGLLFAQNAIDVYGSLAELH
jgi:hypothetical protein